MTTQTGKAPAKQRPIKVKPLTWLGGPWRRRAFLHPFFGALVVAAIGSGVETARKLGQYPTWGLALTTIFIGLLATFAGVLSAAGEKFAEVARLYLGATGAMSGAWLTVVAIMHMYGPVPLLIWIGCLVLFTAGYPGMRHAQLLHEARWRAFRAAPTPPKANPAPAAPPVDPEAAKWEVLLAGIGIKGMRFRERVPTRAGFAVHMSLPANGRIKARTLANKAEDLEIAAGMPAGSITVEPAVDKRGRELAGEVWIYFDVEDILTQTLPMPEEHTELSVNDAFPVGLFADGAPILLKLREIAALIVGVRGRGKTNLLNVIIYQLSRCTDVVLWMIDLKGGRAAKPWLRPWLDGTVKRPVLDWVATTAAEAYRMLVAAKALIDQRSNAGYGGTKIKPSRRRPAVIVICDEVAALVGRHAKPQGRLKLSDLVALLTLCIQLGRTEAVDFVLATQRATVTMTGGGDLKSQCEMRIGLGVTSPQDAQSVFQGNTVAAKLLTKLKNFATRGAVLVQNGDGGRIAPGKSFFMGDDRECLDLIYRAAKEHALLPAPLDPAGAAVVDAAVRALGDGQGYADRWSEERSAHLYSDSLDDDWTDDEAEGDDELVSAGVPATPKPTTPAAGTQPQTPRDDRPRSSRFFERKRTRPDRDGQPAKSGSDPYAEEWEAIVAHFDKATADEVEYRPSEPEEPGKVSRYDRMLQIIKDAGDAGIKPGQILAQMTAEGTAWEERTSIYPALKKAIDDRKIHQPAGPRGVYVYRGDYS